MYTWGRPQTARAPGRHVCLLSNTSMSFLKLEMTGRDCLFFLLFFVLFLVGVFCCFVGGGGCKYFSSFEDMQLKLKDTPA